MKYLRRFILFIIVVLVIGVIVAATCPAQVAYGWIENRLGAVKLSGISGSIWQGHASSVQVFGAGLGALDWQLQVAPLLHGAAIARLALSGEVTASGDFERDIDGTIEGREIIVRAPARMAAPALDIPALQLLGEIDATITQLRLRGAWPDTANGTVHWRNAAVTGAAQAQLGDFEGTFATAADSSITGVVRDLGGPLQLNGTFKISAGSYDAEARLVARDGNAQVIEALRYIGEPQADGSSLLKIHGQLFKLF